MHVLMSGMLLMLLQHVRAIRAISSVHPAVLVSNTTFVNVSVIRHTPVRLKPSLQTAAKLSRAIFSSHRCEVSGMRHYCEAVTRSGGHSHSMNNHSEETGGTRR
jgi:hypothetical protein